MLDSAEQPRTLPQLARASPSRVAVCSSSCGNSPSEHLSFSELELELSVFSSAFYFIFLFPYYWYIIVYYCILLYIPFASKSAYFFAHFLSTFKHPIHH